MSENVIVPGLTDDEQSTFDRLLDQLRQKHRRNLLRASYYDGKRAIRQVGTVIPPQYYRLGLVLGWSAKAVDTLADRCNLDRFVWPDGDLDGIGGDVLFADNDFGMEVASALVSSQIHGVVFAINTQGGVAAGEPRSLIHFKDAMSATGDWNARTRRLDSLLSVTEWETSKRGKAKLTPTSFALYLDGVTIVAERDSSGWTVDHQDHPWGVPVEALVYKPRTGRPFGTSRISRPVMSLHDQALRTIIRMEGHADIYSFPQMWMLGGDMSLFKNADGTQKAAWQLMLGRMFGIPDDLDAAEAGGNGRAQIQQVSAASPQPHIDQLRQQAQLFAGETSVPLNSLGVADMSNPTSADSYAASREDLIALAEKATGDWWGPRLARSYRRGLAILGGLDEVPPEFRSIAPKWRSPIYLSRAAEADAGLKQLTAAEWLKETEVGLELLGLDDQQIKRAMSERRRADGRGVMETLRAAAEAATANADGQ